MPVHLYAPFAAAAAWGALQDCDADARDSPRVYKEGEDPPDGNSEDENDYTAAFEQRLSSSYVVVDEAERCSSDDTADRNSNNQQPFMNNDGFPHPSIQHSTSTFGEAGGPALSFSEPPNSLRMLSSFNHGAAGGTATTLAGTMVMGPTKTQQQGQNRQRSVILRRGSSQLSVSSMGNALSGFVDGDFASGKVRDIPVDGCFVMQFIPQSHNLLAVGARKSVDFYETTSYSIAYRLPQETQVSALQWLSSKTSDKSSKDRSTATTNAGNSRGGFGLGRNLLAVGDLGGNVTLLQVEDEILEMYGPTIVHRFIVEDQIRSIDLQHVGDTILLVVGDKSGKVTFSSYTMELELISNRVAHHIENGRILSVSIQAERKLLALSMMSGGVSVHRLQEGVQLGNWQLASERLFSCQRRGAVRSIIFSKTSNLLALGGYDKTLVMVDTNLWAVVRELKLEGTINVIEFDPYGRYLAVGTRDKSFVLFDTSTFVPIKTFHTPGWVTSISWGSRNAYKDLVSVRSERSCISLLDLTPICRTRFEFDNMDNSTECDVSWSQSGRYCARLQGSSMILSDSHSGFRDCGRFSVEGTLRGVSFCPTETNEDVVAIVGLDGHLTVLRMRPGGRGFTFEVIKAIFVEENLWVVRWSPDGSIIATGGRGKVVHLFNSDTFENVSDPIKIDGRVWGIAFRQHDHSPIRTSPTATGDTAAFRSTVVPQLAVASGADVAIIFDEAFAPCLHIHRPRTARTLCYHPTLPLVAIGDGSGYVAIVDVEHEDTIKEFRAGTRINTLDFSPKGDFLVVGTDECLFTLYETMTYEALQNFHVQGFGMKASFSPNGQCLILGSSEGIYSIVRLGPLLGVDLVPLDMHGGVEQLPEWALKEVLFRSGDGPSFIQRHMRKGEQDNLMRVAKILEQHPEAIYAFDRKANEGCFDTALLLRKPNLLKLAVTSLVGGNLKLEGDAILTSSIPIKAREALEEIIENFPPEMVVDIMQEMSFMKVPFSKPVIVNSKDCQECGSSSYMDPWTKKVKTPSIFTDREEPLVTRGSFTRTPAVLPLPGMGKMVFLSSLLVNAPPTVFDNDAMAVVLRVLWKNHIQKYFIFDLILYMIFFILWIVLVDFNSARSEPVSHFSVQLVASAVFVFNALFAAKELVQSDFGRRPGYITSIWNLVDLLSIGCVLYYTVTACFMEVDELTVVSDPLAVVTSLLLTVKLISYLRGISDTGWLVSVLVQNLHDVRGFLVILFAILVGYTTAFRVLFGHVGGQCELELDTQDKIQQSCAEDPFGSYPRAFVSSFQMIILGEYEEEMLYASQNTVLAIVVFILAVTCVLIVALNALISILADSYARVQENAAANRRKERAELIVEYMSILPASKRKSIEKRTTYFHALLEADADGDLVLGREDWQGGLNSLRKEMEELITASTEQNQRALDQFKSEIDSEIAGLRKDVVKILEEVAGDVRNIRRLQSHDGITLNGKNVARAVNAVKGIGRRGQKVVFGGQGG